jgi:hypothetical protein
VPWLLDANPADDGWQTATQGVDGMCFLILKLPYAAVAFPFRWTCGPLGCACTCGHMASCRSQGLPPLSSMKRSGHKMSAYPREKT